MLARVQHSLGSGAKQRQRTFGLGVLRIREDLVDHEPGIGVFFELKLESVKSSAQARSWRDIRTWLRAAWAAFCYTIHEAGLALVPHLDARGPRFGKNRHRGR
jgi:hypothetical protein